MRRFKRIPLVLLASSATLAVSGLAMGQAAPTASAAGAPSGHAAADRTQPADRSRATASSNDPNATPPPPPPLWMTMQQNGGSLAMAALASQPVTAGGASQAPAFSFYSVPAPKPKTYKKHDLITIVVREESAFSSQGTSDLQRHQDFDAQIQEYMQLHFNPLSLTTQQLNTPLELSTSHDRNFKGTAEVDRTDTMTARITAEVIDVKPNGNLVLQATKKIKTDEEVQEFKLIGTCRAEDLTPDNTVLSTQLYSLELTKNHQGEVRDTTERGFIQKLLDSINPF